MFKASGKLSIYMDGNGTASVSESEEYAIERTTFQGCRAFRFHTLQSDKNCCHCRTGGIWIHPSKEYMQHCPGAPSPQPLLKALC